MGSCPEPTSRGSASGASRKEENTFFRETTIFGKIMHTFQKISVLLLRNNFLPRVPPGLNLSMTYRPTESLIKTANKS